MTSNDTSHDKQRDPQTLPLWVQAICTVVIALTTIGYVCIASRQAGIAARQTQLLDQQRKMMVADQRARVFIDSVSLKRDAQDATMLVLSIRARNFGKGPAELSWIGAADVGANGMLTTDCSNMGRYPVRPVPPNKSLEVEHFRQDNLAPDQHFKGKLCYRDQFGRIHHTIYCVVSPKIGVKTRSPEFCTFSQDWN